MSTEPILLDDTDENDIPDAGIYPQDDGTVNAVLDIPLTRGDGEEIYTVKLLRAPTAGEINKAGGRAMLLQMYDSAHMEVLPNITEPQITKRIYEKMEPQDQQILIMGVVHFLGRLRRRGTMMA